MSDSTTAAAVPPAGARPTVSLRPGAHRRVLGGHPWIYSNEVVLRPETKALAPGSLVRIVSNDGRALGTAMFNPLPLICGRMLSPDPEGAIDRAFLSARLARALALRERLFEAPFYRLVHAEADGLPGTVIDRFGAALVLQVNTAGMERLLPDLLGAIEDLLAPEVVLLRNDGATRALEGLEPYVRFAKGGLDGPVRLVENGVAFLTDLREGQKTGWFFDQRENRAWVAHLAPGLRVLDLYSYVGGFAVQAAVAGAAEVVAVDRSQAALDLAQQSAALNGVGERCHFRRAEVFDELQRLAAAAGPDERPFDLVIADPPAFVKSRKDIHQGARAYRKLARLGAALVRPSGFLFVASCSHNMPPDLFAEQLRRGLTDAGRTGRILRSAGAAADHPVHPALPETAYLKAQVLQLD